MTHIRRSAADRKFKMSTYTMQRVTGRIKIVSTLYLTVDELLPTNIEDEEEVITEILHRYKQNSHEENEIQFPSDGDAETEIVLEDDMECEQVEVELKREAVESK